MGIETVGGAFSRLSTYDSEGWSKSADLKLKTPLSIDDAPGVKESVAGGETKSFSELLAASLGNVNKLQQDANVQIQKLTTGENKNLSETMLAVEKAEIAFKAMNQVRMKVIDAYKEIIRMQL